ncbi:YicC family protein [Aureibaculum marinum]|uniref:YicC family protein n=1 Tax=Aureibaculum marinum TaxID=2487930 RepID=A0A3N4NT57_9FLAO|nr:YicC/YloC family endoribonuclease [Aureibaculum marinum]RPD97528.1 YicC family protein [Aureibaculum marinum]
MIQSMTGYGKAVAELPQKKVTVEIKTLNSKNLDLNVRVPSMYREKELEIRSKLSKKLFRGKVDFTIHVESTGGETTSIINQEVVNNYIDQLRSVTEVSSESLLEIAMRLPDVLKCQREEFDETEWVKVEQTIDEAIDEVLGFRADEGAVLAHDFTIRIQNIQKLSEEVAVLDKERLAQIRERLEKAVADLKQNVDENRFEQELMYYLEKLDITEEKVRLNNHLDYFLQALISEESNGKKLGFICQEIGREINTTGSKSNFAAMQKVVVQMKDELEKIKEQLLNVL